MKKWLKKMYQACVDGDVETQRTMWEKITKKSLKHKNTHTIK